MQAIFVALIIVLYDVLPLFVSSHNRTGCSRPFTLAPHVMRFQSLSHIMCCPQARSPQIINITGCNLTSNDKE